MKRFPWWMVALALLAGAAGVWFSLPRHAPMHAESPAVAALFHQSMPDLRGQPQMLSQWRGKTVLVNFWATWCPPCVQEMPELSALQTELGASKLQIIGIGIDSPSNIHEFAEKRPVSYPLYVGGMGATELSRQLGNDVGGLPFTVLLDATGTVRHTWRGRLEINEVRRTISELTAR